MIQHPSMERELLILVLVLVVNDPDALAPSFVCINHIKPLAFGH